MPTAVVDHVITTAFFRAQFARYAFVGVASNALLYLAYLALTRMGVEPKLAMTASFVTGIASTFLVNRSWTFTHKGRMSAALARYLAAYAAGYFIDLAALAFFVDRGGYNHRIVQGALVCVIALFLFLAQRYWVFSTVPPAAHVDEDITG